MEQFIERSNALLKARPDTARVSTTFTHKKVPATDDRVDVNARPTKVVIKTYDPPTGIVYRYKVRRFNELSRVLASLGPQKFEFAAGRKRGIASYMCGVELPEAASEAPAAEDKKSKKKKN